ncbi:MAG TPA: type II toxin-antitoxin system prevent-host-death family antitoxin [Thermoanaerobaculia bacterium]|nr:type II toxin-antitoxin system prevent-host-death family antitoxin [Thermoanaerobaculia bacterium]
MSQHTVGIRQLKEQLSHYVEQVKTGDTVLITEKGKPVGRIVPVAPSIRERLEQLAEANLPAWSGKKLGPQAPVVPSGGAKTVADLLLEDRE